jgi:hypothetical protein
MADARVRVIGDITQYAEEIRKIPGMTDAAAVKAAMALEARLAKAQERAGASAAKAAMTAADGAKKATAELADSLAGVNKVSQIFGGVLGPLGGALDDSGDLMEKFGLKTAGTVVAIGAAVAAAVAVASALHDVYLAGSQTIATWDETVKAAGGASAATMAYEKDVRAAAAAQQAADRASAHLSLVLGGELAPAVQKVNELQSAMYAGAELAVVGIGLIAQGAGMAASALSTMERPIETAVGLMGPLGAGAVGAYEGLKLLVDVGAEYNEQLKQEALLYAELEAGAKRVRDAAKPSDGKWNDPIGLAEMAARLDKEEAEAAKARQEAQQRANEAARRAEQQAARAQQATQQLVSITDTALASQMNAYDKIVDVQNHELERIEELERVSGAHMEADLARMAVTNKAIQEQAALRDAASQAFVDNVNREAAAEAAKQAEAAQGAQGGLRDLISEATFAQLDAEGQLIAQRDRQLEQIAELERVSGEHALAEQARSLTMLEAEEALTEARAESARVAAEAAKTAQAAQMASAGAVSQSVAQATGALLSLFDSQGEGSKEAARAAFAINKAAALANIAIHTAEAIAAASPVVPLMVAAGIAGAAEAAVVAATPPPFHAGRYSQPTLLSDEQTATLRQGEVVVPAPTVMAAGGPERIRERVERSSSEVMTTIRLDFTDRSVVQPLTKTLERQRSAPRLGWSTA